MVPYNYYEEAQVPSRYTEMSLMAAPHSPVSTSPYQRVKSGHVPLRQSLVHEISASREVEVSGLHKQPIRYTCTACARQHPYKTPRGLREHLTLKHDMSVAQARHVATLAFKNSTPEIKRLHATQGLESDSSLAGRARVQPGTKPRQETLFRAEDPSHPAASYRYCNDAGRHLQYLEDPYGVGPRAGSNRYKLLEASDPSRTLVATDTPWNRNTYPTDTALNRQQYMKPMQLAAPNEMHGIRSIISTKSHAWDIYGPEDIFADVLPFGATSQLGARRNAKVKYVSPKYWSSKLDLYAKPRQILPSTETHDARRILSTTENTERYGDLERIDQTVATPMPLRREQLPEASTPCQTRLVSIGPSDQISDSSPGGTVSEPESDTLGDDPDLDFTDPNFDSTFKPLLPLALSKLQEGYAGFCNRPSGPHCGSVSNVSGDTRSIKSIHASGKNVGKRKRIETFEDGDDGEGDEPTQDPCQADLQEVGDEIPRLLACPYYKFNSRRHSLCRGFTLRGINNVKQHLRRKHSRPLHCPACYTRFKDENERDRHIRLMSCIRAELREVEGISDEQWRQLDKRASKKNTVEENWYLTYEILFPGMDRPDSPYLDAFICEHVESIRNFIDAEGGAQARGLVQTFVTLEGLPRDNQVEEWGHRLLQEFLRSMLEDIVNRDQPLSSTLPETRISAAEHQLPTPVSVNRPNSAVSPSVAPSQRHASDNIPSIFSQRHPMASSVLPTGVQQETTPALLENYDSEYSWSQKPMFETQSFGLEGINMHPSFPGLSSDLDSSLHSLFSQDDPDVI